jgi:sulfur relay (sulfurtransferase) complex TusBCD TusD component (DsrE family)
MSSILFVVNDAPYGNERAYNALRLAGSLAAKEDVHVRVFLMADAVGCAKGHQKVPSLPPHGLTRLKPSTKWRPTWSSWIMAAG